MDGQTSSIYRVFHPSRCRILSIQRRVATLARGEIAGVEIAGFQEDAFSFLLICDLPGAQRRSSAIWVFSEAGFFRPLVVIRMF